MIFGSDRRPRTFSKSGIPPRKLTWQWKIHHLKMYFLLNMGIFQPAMLVFGSVTVPGVILEGIKKCKRCWSFVSKLILIGILSLKGPAGCFV